MTTFDYFKKDDSTPITIYERSISFSIISDSEGIIYLFKSGFDNKISPISKNTYDKLIKLLDTIDTVTSKEDKKNE